MIGFLVPSPLCPGSPKSSSAGFCAPWIQKVNQESEWIRRSFAATNNVNPLLSGRGAIKSRGLSLCPNFLWCQEPPPHAQPSPPPQWPHLSDCDPNFILRSPTTWPKRRMEQDRQSCLDCGKSQRQNQTGWVVNPVTGFRTCSYSGFHALYVFPQRVLSCFPQLPSNMRSPHIT